MSDTENLTTLFNMAMAAVSTSSVGVAVSGGGDSVALLRLLCDWGRQSGREIHVATVNHNLRKEAGAEAEFVAKLCNKLNVPHCILSWDNWDGQGNLQNAARNARKVLLTTWAQERGLATVALGHTQDDQAETFLMRLARGSGVDGLSGMQQINGDNPAWIRPLLQVSRMELRQYLRGLGQDWVEDPSNEDEKFDRIKIRNALPVLAELGLTVPRLAGTAHGLQPARAALEHATQAAAQQCCKPDKFGAVSVDLNILQTMPSDIQYRVICHCIGWVTGANYRPRFSALKSVYGLLREGKSQTLAGCYLKALPEKQVIVMRELAKMLPAPVENALYDGRWQVSAEQEILDVDIRPLGEKGLMQLKNWHNLDVRRDILLQTPAAWQNQLVISAPLAGLTGPVCLSLKTDLDQFYECTVSR